MTMTKHVFDARMYFSVNVVMLDKDMVGQHQFEIECNRVGAKHPPKIVQRDIEAELYRRGLFCAIVTITVHDTPCGSKDTLENRVFYSPTAVDAKVNPIKEPFCMTRTDYNRSFPYGRPEWA